MRTLTSVAALLVAISSAAAQSWPTRPVALVVPFAAGGSSDAIGRIMADGLNGPLGQSIVVENVTGAGGMAGGTRVARAAPDGYQFVIGNVGSFAQSQWIYKNPPYDVLKDFAPVGLITDESLVLVTRKDFPANNLSRKGGVHVLRPRRANDDPPERQRSKVLPEKGDMPALAPAAGCLAYLFQR